MYISEPWMYPLPNRLWHKPLLIKLLTFCVFYYFDIFPPDLSLLLKNETCCCPRRSISGLVLPSTLFPFTVLICAPWRNGERKGLNKKPVCVVNHIFCSCSFSWRGGIPFLKIQNGSYKDKRDMTYHTRRSRYHYEWWHAGRSRKEAGIKCGACSLFK